MDKLYKGYVLTKNKGSIEPIKGVRKFKTLEDVKDEPEYAGVLANDVILIDIDDKDQSDILMQIVDDLELNCRVYATTRGRHFLFKNSGVKSCGTHIKLACGLVADIKVGGKNTYEVIKIDGKDRFVELDVDEYGELPMWLHPVKSNVNFLELDEGDGRNDTLYKYILTLSSAGFTKEQSRECIEIINSYVLPTPLGERELETILRDEAFPVDLFFSGNKFLHDSFATFLKNNENIKRINGQLSIYKDGVYISGKREIEHTMIQYIPSLRDAQRSEVLKYLEIMCSENVAVAGANLIAFNNGIYNLETNSLLPFSPDIVITNKIPWDYNPDAYSELLDATLDKIACRDSAIRSILEEAVGYCFYRRNELSKAFFLTGEGANGKSTYLDIINNVLGKKNTSALELKELDERFSLATMFGKLANVADDISDDFLQGKAIANLKKIVSGNEIKAEFKGQDAFFFNPYVKVFMSANTLPRTKSSGFSALKRRLVIIPFNAKFTKDDPDYDPYIKWKLMARECAEYMIRIGIEGLKRVLENNEFTQSLQVEREIKNYEIENNPILLYMQEHDIEEFLERDTKEVHREYRTFCAENGFYELTLANFSREVNKKLGLATKRVRVDGKQITYYVRGG